MNELFLTNYSEERFVDHLKQCFKKCSAFYLTVSFIKEAGLILIKNEIEEALKRGVEGKLITSTYQNFTDVNSLDIFKDWMEKYPNFQCHLDFNCFGDNGFHSKGYIFKLEEEYEFLVGSSNITRFALLKNIEWNVSLVRKDNNEVISASMKDFNDLWDRTLKLNNDLIKEYKELVEFAIVKWDMDYVSDYKDKNIRPNAMQKVALKELRRYRDTGVTKALIVAATASGKTYLAAFDARNFDAKRILFIVHRENILLDAKKTFTKVFGEKKSYGLFTGNEQNLSADFIFATNGMVAKHLDEFDANEFDYIILDECHHAAASTYKKIMDYFNPMFLLGLTATPERMDNEDVFGMFDKNVPYELRLRDAILNDLIVPFKYYGVRDEFVDYSDKEKQKFLSDYYDASHCKFITDEIEKHRPKGKLKAIAFCKNVEHCKLMANAMSDCGYCTVALTGENSTGERSKGFSDLQNDKNPLEIIFTVDILNEGVDIPAVNMVLFLRPTESQTIFIQQLGRGLRKYPNKGYLTVLDFIGNSYDRSVQIAFALGTLSSTTYIEKPLIMGLVRNDFVELNLPGVEIHFDELAKEEILKYIEKTNFNKLAFLKQDYLNFKKYLLITDGYPKHIDYLNNECAPDLMRFMKASSKGGKNYSYYNFLKKVDQEVPLFTDSEIDFINKVSDLLPLTRRDEYLIIENILCEDFNFDELIKKYPRVNKETLDNAFDNLGSKEIVIRGENSYKLNLENDYSLGFIEYLSDLLDYGLERYENEFGDFEGKFKLYSNYQKDKIMLEIDGKQYSYMQGTKYDVASHITYVFIGLKKDIIKKENYEYKDKFISSSIFQWESVNNTTKTNPEGIKLLNTEVVHLFVRKMDSEDGIPLPFTYFGTGKFTNYRESSNGDKPTLMFDIVLDNEVPEQYRFDFNIPEEIKN